MSRVNSVLVHTLATSGALDFALKVKRSAPTILMYHGVTTADTAPDRLKNCEGKHLPAKLFAGHLQAMRRSRRVIKLDELVRGLQDGDDMTNTIVITFDDGYENNVLEAAPLLADFNMSAAFFLATGFIGAERCIWTDRLEIALDRTHRSSVQVPAGGGDMPLTNFVEKRKAMSAIKRRLKAQPAQNVNQAVEKIISMLGVMDIAPEGDYRFMNWDQARELVRNGFEVGAHSVNHPILSNIPFDEASQEILDSKKKIESETGQCNSTFCVPNGKKSDFTPELVAMCKKHFKAVLSTERGVATVDDLFQLKRLSPGGPGKGENLAWLLLRAR
ncbi:polysaccharide deacetylase family protein [soil metagenome]